MFERRYIECSCNDPAHVLRFGIDDKEIYVNVHLSKRGLLSRIRTAIKHIFGYRSMYGCFEETILMTEQIEELRNLCDDVLGSYDDEVHNTDDDEYRNKYVPGM